MLSTKKMLTPEETNRYWDAYFATVDTLVGAHTKLSVLEDAAADLGERRGFRADRLRVEANLELMRARHAAFIAQRGQIMPPSQILVDGVVALVKRVMHEQAIRERAGAIVGLATKAMNEFSKIQA